MKTYQYENFHEVEAAVVFCVDPRFWRQTIQFVEDELGITKFDPYTYPGGPLCLKRDESKELYINNIRTASIELHHANKIILISHERCGGYKLMEGVEGEEALTRQVSHLHSIKEMLEKEFPEIIIEEYMMHTISDSELTFEKI